MGAGRGPSSSLAGMFPEGRHPLVLWLALVVAWATSRPTAAAAVKLAPAVVAAAGATVSAPAPEATQKVPQPRWLPQEELDDYECRRRLPSPTLDWAELRGHFQELIRHALDESSLLPAVEDAAATAWRKALQVEMLQRAGLVMLRFPQALVECPMGAAATSIFAACLAHLPRDEVFDGPLPQPLEAVLVDLRKRSFAEMVARDLRLLLDLAPVHVVAATEWSVFAVLHLYIGRLRPTPGPKPDVTCPGTAVAGNPSEKILQLLSRHMAFASGRDVGGLKFLRGLDGLVTSIMKDPTEFSVQYVQECPPAGAAFSVAAAMLALMSNPSLFERFSRLAHSVLRGLTAEVLAGAATWGVFHALAKLAAFATRSFDLVWSAQELLPVPSEPEAFDALRLDPETRSARLLAAAAAHPHEPTRQLAAFLATVAERLAATVGSGPELIVYLTAVGGPPFSEHIAGFVQRAAAVGLPALVVACMDPEAQERCEEASGGLGHLVHCVPALEGHVVLIKHAFIPVLLSAAVDTVWVDFDTFILRDPTASLLWTLQHPGRILPERSRLRYGSFLFHNASDACHLAKLCDARQHWEYNISEDPSTGVDGPGVPVDSDAGVEILVTEHWDARCLNNGFFYVRATHRPLVFFSLFLTQLYVNPYADNQNLFDAFLAHSTVDSAAPDDRPLLRYALLDIERQFACAEGHMGSPGDLVTFHFWSSDFKTREAVDSEASVSASQEPEQGPASGGRTAIRLRDGKERVSKTTATKSELFTLFFGAGTVAADTLGLPPAAADFIERTRTPPPNWKGMCSVTAVGVEDLMDERMLQENRPLLDWQQATTVLAAPEALTEARPDAAADFGPPAASGVASGPQCSGVPLRDWVEGLQRVAELEDAGLLAREGAAILKAQLRRLDVGCLLVLQAYGSYGRERLALELQQMLVQDKARAPG